MRQWSDQALSTFTGTAGPHVIVLYDGTSGNWPDVLRRELVGATLVELSPELERLALDVSIGHELQAFIADLRRTRRPHYWPETHVDPREHRRVPTRRPPVRAAALERRGRSRGARRGRIVRRYLQRKGESNRRP